MFHLGRATLCWCERALQDLGAVRSCHSKGHSTCSSKSLAAAWIQEEDPLACQHQRHCSQQHALAAWDFHFALAVGLLSLIPTHIKVHLHWIWASFLSSPLAWCGNVINLSLAWSMWFLSWLIKRHYPECLLAYGIPAQSELNSWQRQSQSLGINLPLKTIQRPETYFNCN